LLPLAAVVAPNLVEAAVLVGFPVDDRDAMVAAAEALLRFGPEAVLLKGGHLGDDGESPDLLCTARGVEWLEGRRLPAVHTHGTGCVLSAAITAYLALGHDVAAACRDGKRFVTAAIAAGRPLGAGIGPVDPGWARLSGSADAEVAGPPAARSDPLGSDRAGSDRAGPAGAGPGRGPRPRSRG
jgi:hydroxymethylpyrimidine/phosphomethylpyrimidine kinase